MFDNDEEPYFDDVQTIFILIFCQGAPGGKMTRQNMDLPTWEEIMIGEYF